MQTELLEVFTTKSSEAGKNTSDTTIAVALHAGSTSHQKSKQRQLNRQAPGDPSGVRPTAWPVPTYKGQIPLLVAQSPPAIQNTVLSPTYGPYLSASTAPASAFQRDFGKPEPPQPARADDRDGERVLHGARVEDADDLAGPGHRDDGEERPVQPVLAVQLDDLRKHPRSLFCIFPVRFISVFAFLATFRILRR